MTPLREPWRDSNVARAIGPVESVHAQQFTTIALNLLAPVVLLAVLAVVGLCVVALGFLYPRRAPGGDLSPVYLALGTGMLLVLCLVLRYARRQGVVYVLLGARGIALWRTDASWAILWDDLPTWIVRMSGLEPGETWLGTDVILARRDGQERTITGTLDGIETIQARIWTELLQRIAPKPQARR